MQQNNLEQHDRLFDLCADTPRLEGYLTGFFDADGHVGLYAPKGTPTPVISFSNNDEHVLNFIQYAFSLQGIDFTIYPKSKQLRISSWKYEDSLRGVVEFLLRRSQVKRSQLALMLKAIDKYYSLPGRKRKKYTEQDKKEFKEIDAEMRKAKRYWADHSLFALLSKKTINRRDV